VTIINEFLINDDLFWHIYNSSIIFKHTSPILPNPLLVGLDGVEGMLDKDARPTGIVATVEFYDSKTIGSDIYSIFR